MSEETKAAANGDKKDASLNRAITTKASGHTERRESFKASKGLTSQGG